MGKFINPFTDWGFKKIFGQEINKDCLITFLNSLFDGEHVITDLTFLDKEQLPEVKDMRGIIYDVYCQTESGAHIIVEMQNRDQVNFIDRTIFYMSRAISGQGKRGDWNYRLDAVYGVFFMNFDSSELNNGKLRTDIALTDMDTHRLLTDKVRMIYLQLPYFTKSEQDCDTLFDCFIYTLKNMEILDRMPFIARNAVFEKLAQIADVSTLTKEEHDKYDASIKVLRDNIVTHMAARNEGREEGRAEGRKDRDVQIVRNLKSMGMSVDFIMQATGLSEEEISKL